MANATPSTSIWIYDLSPAPVVLELVPPGGLEPSAPEENAIAEAEGSHKLLGLRGLFHDKDSVKTTLLEERRPGVCFFVFVRLLVPA